jgi:hypothetical protein
MTALILSLEIEDMLYTVAMATSMEAWGKIKHRQFLDLGSKTQALLPHFGNVTYLTLPVLLCLTLYLYKLFLF